MTDAETKTIEAVTRALIGEFQVGARVRTKYSGREGVVHSLRVTDFHGIWVRIRLYDTGGHWEYHSSELDLI